MYKRQDKHWGDTDLIFDLEEAGEGATKLTFTHRGMHEREANYDQVARAWEKRLYDRLEPLIRDS